MDQVTHIKTSGGLSPGTQDFDQCVRMTDAALARGCDTDDSVCYNSDRANVLFEMNDCTRLRQEYSGSAKNMLNYLVNKGVDLEKRNFLGLTPLLHAVTAFKPQSLKCLETFVRRGANIHATNFDGQGALHLALLGPHRFYNFGYQHHLRSAEQVDASDQYWRLRIIFHTEADSAAQYSCGHHEQCKNINFEQDHEVQQGKYYDALAKDWAGEQRVLTLVPNFAHGTASVNQGLPSALPKFKDVLPDFIRCKDYDGVEHLIRHPVKVLKAHLRLVLLTLLRAGCDPNVLDDRGNPPSFYAEENMLWPEWSWALQHAAYTYDMTKDQWVQAVGLI